MAVVLVNPAGSGARRVSRRKKVKPRRKSPSATRRRRNPKRKAARKNGGAKVARVGRTKSGRVKKGYRLTKGGRVIKAKGRTKRKTTTRKKTTGRKPKGKVVRPRLRKTSRGLRAGKRSKTFKRKQTIVRKNPKFQLKRVLSTKTWVSGLTDAGTLLLGVAGQNVLKTQVNERVLDAIGLDGQGRMWANKALCVVNAALLGEATRVFVRKPAVAKLVFAGALFQVVKDTIIEFMPQAQSYLGAYSWPGAGYMDGYMDEGTAYSPVGSTESMAGYLAI